MLASEPSALYAAARRIPFCRVTIPRVLQYGPPMFRTLCTLASGCLLVAISATATGQPADPAAPAGGALSKEEIAGAAKIDAVSIPTPGELMAALNKFGKPDWAGQIRPPIAMNRSSRAEMAINIGGLIADGYLAVEAEDAQQVKNVGRDIMTLAKPLGVQQDILNRGKSLTEFAEGKQWDQLKEGLEATQNEVKVAMGDNKDQDLVALVTVGGWLRGTEVISEYISTHYTDEAARLLRQPAIVRYLAEKVNGLPEKVRDDPAVKKVRMRLLEIEQAVSFPRDSAPNVEAVKRLHALTEDLMKDLAKKVIK